MPIHVGSPNWASDATHSAPTRIDNEGGQHADSSARKVSRVSTAAESPPRAAPADTARTTTSEPTSSIAPATWTNSAAPDLHHAPGFQIMTISRASVASPITTYSLRASGSAHLADRALELAAGAGRDEPEDDRGDVQPSRARSLDVEGEPDAEHEHAEPAGVPERAGRRREHAPRRLAPPSSSSTP